MPAKTPKTPKVPRPLERSPSERAADVWALWIAEAIEASRRDGGKPTVKTTAIRRAHLHSHGSRLLLLASAHGATPLRLTARTAEGPWTAILPRYGHRYACAVTDLYRLLGGKIDGHDVRLLRAIGALVDHDPPTLAPTPTRGTAALWVRVDPFLVAAWIDAGVLAPNAGAGYLPPNRPEVFESYHEMPYVR